MIKDLIARCSLSISQHSPRLLATHLSAAASLCWYISVGPVAVTFVRMLELILGRDGDLRTTSELKAVCVLFAEATYVELCSRVGQHLCPSSSSNNHPHGCDDSRGPVGDRV